MLARFASPAIVGMVVALTAVELAPSTATVAARSCRPDAKLIGLIEVSTDDRPLTWWRLTREGFNAAGMTTEAEYEVFIEAAFGQDYANLDDAIAALVEAVSALDFNTNGYVCAYNIRGTRTSYGDPSYANYLFQVRDDGFGK